MTTPLASGPSAGSRRFWFTVLFFLLANVAVWIGYHHWQEARLPGRDILAVQTYTPGEDAELDDARPAFAWTFNLDVGTPGPVDSVPNQQLPGTFQPPVKGQWSWLTARTLTFEPQERLPRATLYTVSLNHVRTAQGFTLAAPVVHRFTTTALRLLAARQVGFDGDNHTHLELEFNDKVIPGEVLRHLEITTAGGKSVHATLLGQGAGTIVRVLTDPIALTEPPAASTPNPAVMLAPSDRSQIAVGTLRLTITPGLTGSSGPLGITREITQELRVAQVLLADALQPRVPADGNVQLVLTFNSTVPTAGLDAIRPLLQVEPVVEFTATQRGGNDRQIVLDGPFACGTRYTVTIAKAAGPDDPKKLPRPAILSTVVPDRPSMLKFQDTTGFLGSKGNRTVMVKAVNVPAIRIRADRVYENNLVTWRNEESRNTEESSVEAYSRPLASQRFVLAGKKNEMQELRINLDELLGTEAIEGTYRLEMSVDNGTAPADDPEENRRFWRRATRWGDDYNTSLITLSDIGLTAKVMASPTRPATERGLVAWALSLSTGQPLPDIRLRVYSNKNQLLGEGLTDAHGLAQIDHLNPAPDEQPAVVIAAKDAAPQGKSLTWLDLSNMQRNESAFATSGRPYLRTSYEAFLWTPRGVYRPGEEVVLRAIVRGPGVTVPADKLPVRWQIRRPDGRDWLSHTASLDADGAAEWRLTVPADAPTGYWYAQLGLPGDPAAGSAAMRTFGTTDFQVEEFIPNRIKVALTLSDVTALNDGPAPRFAIGAAPLLADVQADYLFGQPAAHLPSQLTVRLAPATFSPAAFPAAQGWIAGDSANVAETLGGTRPMSDRLNPTTQTLDDKGHARFTIDLQHRTIIIPAPTTVPAPAVAPPTLPAHTLPTALSANSTLPVPAPSLLPSIPLTPAPATPALISSPATTRPAASDLYIFHGPWHVSLSAETTETGGRAVTAYAATEADALPYYVMARHAPAATGNGDYAPAGQTVNFDLRLVSPAGTRAEASHVIDATVFHESWNTTLIRNSGRYEYQSTRVLEPETGVETQVTVAPAGGTFTWKPATPGSYIIQFADSSTRQITTLRLYVGEPGNFGGWNDTVNRDHPEQLEVKLIAADAPPAEADKTKPLFHEGQPVTAIVRSPFAGQLLLTVETDTVLLTKTVAMTGTVAEVPLVLPPGAWPNGYIGVTVVRPVDASKEWRTHRAFGLCRFDADPSDQRLTIRLAAPSELRPQRSLDVDLTVTDAHGQTVNNAAVALVAVDEGILRLTSYATPDPLRYFGSTRALGVETADIYTRLMPEIQKLDSTSPVGGGGEGSGDEAGFSQRHSSPVTAKRVRPVALVSDIVHTDATGRAAVHLQVPEFLGQLRLMAIAYSGRAMGAQDQNLLVRSPLVVQSSFPRFLAPGDRCDVPLLVINNSTQAGSAFLQLTTDNQGVLAFDLTQREVTLRPGEQRTVSFQLTAQQSVGIGQISLEARLGEETYTEHLEIPVRPASPAITRGDSLTATPEKALPLKPPAAMLAGTESFELRISQRPVLGLPEGLAYLDHYPYGCLEQITSQCFPLVYLSDIGAQIAPGVFEQDRVARKVQSGITRLIGMQTATGGLSMWPSSTEDWPWGSVYAAHFLIEAQHAGYTVPADFSARLNAYLRSQLAKSTDGADIIEVQAYALYVLALAGTPDRPMMNRLGEVLAQDPKHPTFGTDQARLHLALAWAVAGRKDLAAKLLPEQLPPVRTTRQLSGNVGSPVRDQALMIITLLSAAPDHPALPGLVEKLSAAADDHGWLSTQDNAFAVMAMGKYLRATKDDQPFELAELLRDEQVVATAQGTKPLVWTPPSGGGAGLFVRVTGPAGAKAFVNWRQTGVPLAMPADADHALKIRRQYTREDGSPLPATLTTGTTVRVLITVDTPTALSNLVIEDLLPAGLEPENPRLQTAKRDNPAPDSTKGGIISLPGGPQPRLILGQRLDVRDDRVILVTSIDAGTSTWSYLARAVTPGTYVVPPIRGECMYDPSLNSISGGGAHLTISPLDNTAVARP